MSFRSWLTRPTTKRIRWRESRNDERAVNPTGAFRGLYQMNAAFWVTYGGSLRYVNLNEHGQPIGKGWFEQAPRTMQDHVAYCGYAHRGDAPWGL